MILFPKLNSFIWFLPIEGSDPCMGKVIGFTRRDFFAKIVIECSGEIYHRTRLQTFHSKEDLHFIVLAKKLEKI